MLEFLTMMSVIAMIFCTATVLVALVASGLMRIAQSFKAKKSKI